jgi:signal transduction histidine kinase
VETIVAGAARATEMLRQLLAFSRKQGRTPEPVDLNDAVTRAEPTLSRLVGPHIDFRIHLGPADIIATADDDLEQLLTTLVVSARDLLPIGGVIRIETGGPDAAYRDGSSTDDGAPTAHQTLAVVAAGYGLQPAQATAAIALVARRCGGELTISGEPGRRAVLQVRFPRCSASANSNW